MTARRKATLLRIGGMLCFVGVPVAATLCCFPHWIAQGGEIALPLTGVLCLLLALLPLRRRLRQLLRDPSAAGVWFVIWLSLSLLRGIVDSVIAIAFVSFPAGLFGSLLYRIAARIESTL